jgi:hypothetical protein
MSTQALCGTLSLILLLLAAIVKLWGTELSGAAAGGAASGQAQAAAERRRLRDVIREAWHGNSGGRGLFGRLAGAVRGMRGPRPGATAGTRVPAGSGPLSRIVRAAVTGARWGAARAAGRARRRAAGTSGTRPGGPSGPGRGRPSGPGQGRRRPAKLGVCEECGRVVSRASLKTVPVDRPGGTQRWQLCVLCRSKRAAEPATPGARQHGAGLRSSPSPARPARSRVHRKPTVPRAPRELRNPARRTTRRRRAPLASRPASSSRTTTECPSSPDWPGRSREGFRYRQRWPGSSRTGLPSMTLRRLTRRAASLSWPPSQQA